MPMRLDDEEQRRCGQTREVSAKYNYTRLPLDVHAFLACPAISVDASGKNIRVARLRYERRRQSDLRHTIRRPRLPAVNCPTLDELKRNVDIPNLAILAVPIRDLVTSQPLDIPVP